MRPAPILTPENMAKWWGWTPEVHGGAAGEGRVGAALWRFDQQVDEAIEVTAEPDPHTHIVNLGRTGLVESLYTADGRGRYVQRARRGTLNLVRAGERPRSLVSESRGTLIHVYLPDSLVRRCANEIGTDASAVELIDPRAVVDLQAARIGDAFSAELLSGTDPSKLLIDSLGVQLATHLLRRWSNLAGTWPAMRVPASAGLAPWQLRRVTEAMEGQLDNDPGLTDLAALVGLSPSHLCRSFKVSTGLPPHAWLQQRRMQRARELLANPRLSLTDVAQMVGYSGQSAFGAAFRRSTGLTPSEYRRAR